MIPKLLLSMMTILATQQTSSVGKNVPRLKRAVFDIIPHVVRDQATKHDGGKKLRWIELIDEVHEPIIDEVDEAIKKQHFKSFVNKLLSQPPERRQRSVTRLLVWNTYPAPSSTYPPPPTSYTATTHHLPSTIHHLSSTIHHLHTTTNILQAVTLKQTLA
eukprot:GFUD01132725.1.p1 GENE.GFUD01132725.1~~GFUD01132725.1.p1  ORF type:complete len:160 (-),score=41.23 GFUD01132725.1:86-565(-)